jgi:hypothetical protein
MNELHQIETELRKAVAEVRWLARVLNAADRVAGMNGELPYTEPDDEGAPPSFEPVTAAYQPTDLAGGNPPFPPVPTRPSLEGNHATKTSR